MASLMECESALVPVLRQLLERHSQLQLVVTVSPVRYLRDGLVASQRSKSRLHELVQRLELELPDRVTYFQLMSCKSTSCETAASRSGPVSSDDQMRIISEAIHRCGSGSPGASIFQARQTLHRLRQHRPSTCAGCGGGSALSKRSAFAPTPLVTRDLAGARLFSRLDCRS